jgi:hypothetical protein
MSMIMNDTELAAHLADVAGKILIQVRASDVLSLKALGKAGDALPTSFSFTPCLSSGPMTGFCLKRVKTPKNVCPRAGCGLSIQSMGLVNMAKAAPIGQSMLRWRLMACL